MFIPPPPGKYNHTSFCKIEAGVKPPAGDDLEVAEAQGQVKVTYMA